MCSYLSSDRKYTMSLEEMNNHLNCMFGLKEYAELFPIGSHHNLNTNIEVLNQDNWTKFPYWIPLNEVILYQFWVPGISAECSCFTLNHIIQADLVVIFSIWLTLNATRHWYGRQFWQLMVHALTLMITRSYLFCMSSNSLVNIVSPALVPIQDLYSPYR